jgi:hypothetical protein
MRRMLLSILVLCLVFLPGKLASARQETPGPPDLTATTTPAAAQILSPLPGQALQGKVAVNANTSVPGFQSAELTFAYNRNSLNTWFFLAESDQPVAGGTIAQWDTTTITDGVYNLRLVVHLADGGQQTVNVSGIRVRNYTPIETDTPTPVTPTSTPVPGDTPVPTTTPTATATPVPPTATALPANPMQLSMSNLYTSLGKGALGTIAALALLGLYASARRLRRR